MIFLTIPLAQEKSYTYRKQQAIKERERKSWLVKVNLFLVSLWS